MKVNHIRPRASLTNAAIELSDDQLQNAYFEAVRTGIMDDALEHFRAEMIRRGLLGEA